MLGRRSKTPGSPCLITASLVLNLKSNDYIYYSLLAPVNFEPALFYLFIDTVSCLLRHGDVIVPPF